MGFIPILLNTLLIQPCQLIQGHHATSRYLGLRLPFAHLELEVDSAVDLVEEVVPAALCPLSVRLDFCGRQLNFCHVKGPKSLALPLQTILVKH